MNKKWLVTMLGAAAMSMSAGAMAQQQAATGWYVGADFLNTDIDGIDDDNGFRFLGGYQINRTFAAELGYSNLFDKRVSGVNVEVTAWELVGLARMPLATNFSVFGKLGFAMWDAEVSTGIPGLSASDDGTDLTFGVGLQYDLNRNFGIRGQWQRYDVSEDADVLSIGVVYRF
jgi:OOP family OmpA-OmpF porin